MIDEALTWPSDTADVELMAVVDFEVLLDYRALSLARSVDGREKVFRVDLVMYPLVSGEAYAS